MDQREFLIYTNTLYISDRFWADLDQLDDPRDILTMSEKELKAIPGSYKSAIERILKTRDDDKYIKGIFKNLDTCDQVLTLVDETYPKNLRLIEDPPRVIYVKGRSLDLDGPKLAIVGSRKSTAYGRYVAEKFTRELAKLGATIVSGMAQGIDGIAHKIALEEDTYSIGVLGCGVDVKFPKNHSSLFDKMYERGSIVSEYPPGVSARPEHFPRRNRIISGLSDGIIVVEGQKRSGSLITARLGAEQGKEVFAVPGNINSLYSEGTNRLIRDGAIPLLEIQDLMDQIDTLDNQKEEELVLDLSQDEEEILGLIKEGYKSIDQLVEKTGKTVSQLSPIMTLLEMKNLI